jgi:signal peptidase II
VLNAKKKQKRDNHSFPMVPIIVILVIFLDQCTKFLALKNLSLYQSIPVVKGIFHLTLIHNRGAAFGILKNQLSLFIATAILATALIYHAIRNNRDKNFSLYIFSLTLILAGGIGNLIDRIFLGYVVDFLDFRVWPVFNIADSAITIGAILLGWIILNPKERKSQIANRKTET